MVHQPFWYVAVLGDKSNFSDEMLNAVINWATSAMETIY